MPVVVDWLPLFLGWLPSLKKHSKLVVSRKEWFLLWFLVTWLKPRKSSDFPSVPGFDLLGNPWVDRLAIRSCLRLEWLLLTVQCSHATMDQYTGNVHPNRQKRYHVSVFSHGGPSSFWTSGLFFRFYITLLLRNFQLRPFWSIKYGVEGLKTTREG